MKNVNSGLIFAPPAIHLCDVIIASIDKRTGNYNACIRHSLAWPVLLVQNARTRASTTVTAWHISSTFYTYWVNCNYRYYVNRTTPLDIFNPSPQTKTKKITILDALSWKQLTAKYSHCSGRRPPSVPQCTLRCYSRLCIRMVVSIHAWSVSQWWLTACGVRLLGAATCDGRSVSDSQACRVPAYSLSARSNFSGTLGIYGVETPKVIDNIKQEAIKDWPMSSQYVHNASVNHIDSTHADRLSWHPAPANHHCDTLQAGVNPPFWYTTVIQITPTWLTVSGQYLQDNDTTDPVLGTIQLRMHVSCLIYHQACDQNGNNEH